jgi:hypothetical protein
LEEKKALLKMMISTDDIEQGTIATTAAGKTKTRLVDIEADDDVVSKSRFEERRNLFTRIIQGTAIGAIVVNILGIILEWSTLMLFAGLCGVGLGGGVVYYQQELRGEDTLRTVQNELRHQVNDFADENEKLSHTVTNLQAEVQPLRQTEEQLRVLAEENGMTVDKLAGLVKINKQTLQEMKANLRADVLMSMMDVVLQADRSQDGVFSERELQGLTLRLKMLPTIDMNEDLFKKELDKIKEQKQQMSAMLQLMEQVNHEHIPDDRRVFRLKDDAMDNIVE